MLTFKERMQDGVTLVACILSAILFLVTGVGKLSHASETASTFAQRLLSGSGVLIRVCNICGRPHWSKGNHQNDGRVGWVLTSVRPLVRPFNCRGPVWEFANQVQIRAACSKHIVASWMPGSVSRPLRHTCPSDQPYSFDDLTIAAGSYAATAT